VDQVIRFLSFLALWFVQTTIDQYNALIGSTLDRGKTPAGGTSLTTGAQATLDAPVGGADFVTLTADLTGAASGDLTVQCFPFAADGVTVLTTAIPAVTGVGYPPTLGGGHVDAVQQYNVQGIDKVRFILKNNNAGTQTLNASWRTENY